MNEFRIELCGGIGIGKTTFARRLAAFLPRTTLICEDFNGNPLWKQYYAAPDRYVKEKNISFLAQHFAELKVAKSRVVSDFSPLQDLAYASLIADVEHERVMASIHTHLSRDIMPPNLVLHLYANVDKQFAQIADRGRPEELKLTKSKLAQLNAALENILAKNSHLTSIQSIDVTFVDIRSDENLLAEIAALL